MLERISSEALELKQEYRHLDKQTRLFNDTATWLAETLQGSMRTSFDFSYKNGDIYSEDFGSMKKVFSDSLKSAEVLPANLGFEWRRRNYEMAEFYEMQMLMENNDLNTIVVISDYPPELMNSNESVGGYNGTRKQTMLRVISKTADNKLNITTQSLDLSDRQGLEAIYNYFDCIPKEGELLGQRIHLQLDNIQQELLVDNLMREYDRTLEAKYGGEWRAGIQKATQDTYSFVVSQTDLINYYSQEVEKIGENPSLLYAVASAMNMRYQNISRVNSVSSYGYEAQFTQPQTFIHEELRLASMNARARGDVFDGCGMSISVTNQDEDLQMSLMGYGNKADQKTGYKFDKKMHCVVCQAPPKKSGEPKKMCGPCGICKSCDNKLSNK